MKHSGVYKLDYKVLTMLFWVVYDAWDLTVQSGALKPRDANCESSLKGQLIVNT